jgi:hypothetical protein
MSYLETDNHLAKHSALSLTRCSPYLLGKCILRLWLTEKEEESSKMRLLYRRDCAAPESIFWSERHFGTANSKISSLLFGEDLVHEGAVAKAPFDISRERIRARPSMIRHERCFGFRAAHIDIQLSSLEKSNHVVSMSDARHPLGKIKRQGEDVGKEVRADERFKYPAIDHPQRAWTRRRQLSPISVPRMRGYTGVLFGGRFQHSSTHEH